MRLELSVVLQSDDILVLHPLMYFCLVGTSDIWSHGLVALLEYYHKVASILRVVIAISLH